MKKESNNNRWMMFLRASIIFILFTAVSMVICAAVMYFLELDKSLSPVLSNICLAVGTLVSSFFTSRKVGNKGYLIGLICGGIVFIAVTLISLIVDDSAVSSNTLFHFIIIMLSALIGGISGVNKRPEKYI